MRRRFLPPFAGLQAGLLAGLLVALVSPARADDAGWAALKASPAPIVLFRHAEAPGVGDPPGFRLGDCSTQRNLDARGRAQAKRIGERFRAAGVTVGRVVTSQWCRARDTATLAFPGAVQDAPAFNSIFEGRDADARQTQAATAVLRDWQGPGALVVVTHQVNIQALAGVSPSSGEGVVVAVDATGVKPVARLAP